MFETVWFESDVKDILETYYRELLCFFHPILQCEWLLGNRSKSLTELRDGLPQDSPILQVLLASPQVQISLGNPKMFIGKCGLRSKGDMIHCVTSVPFSALLSMLDNSSTMTMWLSDNDTASVLGHILRTYHEEKHIVAINQFNNAQSFN